MADGGFEQWLATQNFDPNASGTGADAGLGADGKPNVWMGQPSSAKQWAHDGLDVKYPPDGATSQTEALGDFYTWSDTERAAWGSRLYHAGLIADPGDYGAMLQKWQDAVGEAANFYTYGHKQVTPWEVVDLMSGGARGRKPTTRTSTSRNTNLPDPESLNAAIKQIFQDAVGRDPAKGELDRYRSMLTGQFKSHPDVITRTVHTDTKGNETSHSTTQQGLSAEGAANLAENKVQADPEWGAYQAATKYFNLLNSALAAPTNAGA